MKRTGFASILRSYLSAAAAIAVLYAGTSARTHAQARFELRPVETITLKSQQFLIGDKTGNPAILAGELRIPKPGTDKLPAVILVHGSGGIGPAAAWKFRDRLPPPRGSRYCPKHSLTDAKRCHSCSARL